MKYLFIENADINEVDDFVINNSQNSLLQCSSWREVKNNWESVITCVKEDNKIVASALMLIRDVPLGKTLVYIPKGPVMDYNSDELVTFMIDNLVAIAKKRKAIALRFDPVVISRKYFYKNRNADIKRENEEVISLLAKLKAKHKGYTTLIHESTQPRYNAMMEVDDDWLEKVDHKTIKCINGAKKHGVSVYEGREYLKEFYEMISFTENRKGIALRYLPYYENMMDVYGDKAICMVAKVDFNKQEELIKASLEEIQVKLKDDSLTKKARKALEQSLVNEEKEVNKIAEDRKKAGSDIVTTCGIFAVYNDNLMELLYMGNNPDFMRYHSSYLLYASCIERCKELGIKNCSFGGIEGTLDDGLTLFKSNWPMQVEEYIGEFNIVFDKLLYFGFEKVYPFFKKVGMVFRNK